MLTHTRTRALGVGLSTGMREKKWEEQWTKCERKCSIESNRVERQGTSYNRRNCASFGRVIADRDIRLCRRRRHRSRCESVNLWICCTKLHCTHLNIMHQLIACQAITDDLASLMSRKKTQYIAAESAKFARPLQLFKMLRTMPARALFVACAQVSRSRIGFGESNLHI